jgi:hypothetical protein
MMADQMSLSRFPLHRCPLHLSCPPPRCHPREQPRWARAQIHLGIEMNDVLPKNDILNYFRNCAIDLTDKILDTNYEMVKKVLFESEFFDYIMGFLKSRPEELSRDDQQYRQEWINILKKWYPEKLAELM